MVWVVLNNWLRMIIEMKTLHAWKQDFRVTARLALWKCFRGENYATGAFRSLCSVAKRSEYKTMLRK
jgi:hypothetical protein